MNHDAIRALLLSVACFEVQWDRPPTMHEIVEMRGEVSGMIRLLNEQRLIQLTPCGKGEWGWSALVAQGQRTY